MPGKSAPFRTLDTNKDDFGRWLCEVLDRLDIKKIPFVVSSYSSAMLLSLAEISPDRIEKAALVVPSGISHGPLIPIIFKMAVPMMKYYFVQSESSFKDIIGLMSSQNDEQTEEFFDLMMSSYKMEMKPPREFKRDELKHFRSPVMIFASDDDVFFPAYRVFPKARKLFAGRLTFCRIPGHHLPSDKTMSLVCKKIENFFSE